MDKRIVKAYHEFRKPQFHTTTEGGRITAQTTAQNALSMARDEALADELGITVEWVPDDEYRNLDEELFMCECRNPRCEYRPFHGYRDSQERQRQAADIASSYTWEGMRVMLCADDCPMNGYQRRYGDEVHALDCRELDSIWGCTFGERGHTYREMEQERREYALWSGMVGSAARLILEEERTTLEAARAITVMIP
jgi:hypothetical protein